MLCSIMIAVRRTGSSATAVRGIGRQRRAQIPAKLGSAVRSDAERIELVLVAIADLELQPCTPISWASTPAGPIPHTAPAIVRDHSAAANAEGARTLATNANRRGATSRCAAPRS